MTLFFYAYKTTDIPPLIALDFIVDDTVDGAYNQIIAAGADIASLPGLQIAGGMEEVGPARIIAGIPIGTYDYLMVR